MYEIDFFEDADGFSEIQDFIERLDASNQVNDQALLKKIYHEFDLLSMLGPQLRSPHSKFLRGYAYPIMELRPQPERIFYVAWQDHRYILLHHYTKKKNRTDPRQVAKALANLEDWLKRKGEMK
ncbi:type II toxin-antitoxin system RelE/ParE family toxin [Lacticaseibacillus porcinae]|uniref:type II toxin-antitoxin system RelE/ParE family toxin n=1 Tax=Lacticaseibacillus porcinae TaxID=1123687 RepID=UPI000F79019F|nr:type II toxin-antitoxin system RelE/ParE family toxin [Lacticaseibacillus porcinae]